MHNFISKEEFYHFFQPIYQLGGWKKEGYEVILRSKLHPNPEVAFQKAVKAKRLYELDSRSIHKAIRTYQKAGFSKKDGYLFLNIFPSIILNPMFPSFLNLIISNNHLNSQQVVLEISETEIIKEFDHFKQQIKVLKDLGFLIAIDDVGKGYANARAIIELEHDYIKLDRFFSDDLLTSNKKQSFIKYYVDYCNTHNSQLVLEGLETPAD
ncbi:EAL domain-containing protein (putative c-di-GMP-specific phosphodiesterase class I) [Evansella vedderi]|uniref:EAL domain-containing protein (Putative c-di-GMP-specific phosphodiesterase class I) n=1 Tax=Evansella vedderi TaxID=38282 RepID=A0ABT9ZP98_9BACI|nr:EAL domain-containing protein [Evansella vedderi]MDQ0253064.1 EAL domain-containing protein (putative c-di-GMP-specific phosphodiesterase class I) [Evansella vedderi]